MGSLQELFERYRTIINDEKLDQPPKGANTNGLTMFTHPDLKYQGNDHTAWQHVIMNARQILSAIERNLDSGNVTGAEDALNDVRKKVAQVNITLPK